MLRNQGGQCSAGLELAPSREQHKIARQQAGINQRIFHIIDATHTAHRLFIIEMEVMHDAVVKQVLDRTAQAFDGDDLKILREELIDFRRADCLKG